MENITRAGIHGASQNDGGLPAESFDPFAGLPLKAMATAAFTVAIVCIGVVVSALILQTPAQSAEKVAFASSQAAYKQGLGAYRAGRYELALPAFEFAATRGVTAAQFYMAKIYSDMSTVHADQARAFKLFRSIVEHHGEVDPADRRTAPFVARSWTALGRYLKDGVPALRIGSDLSKAVEYFRYAGQAYNDEDSQFELARMHLTGDGVEKAPRHAMHWLAALSRKGHAGAQAFLASVFWQGKYITRDPQRALALVSVAVENALPEDRLWIEDLHHNIFCGVSGTIRRGAVVLVTTWRKRYGRNVQNVRSATGLEGLGAQPDRRCGNGETVDLMPSTSTVDVRNTDQAASAAAKALRPTKSDSEQTAGASIGAPKLGAALRLGAMSFTQAIPSKADTSAQPVPATAGK